MSMKFPLFAMLAASLLLTACSAPPAPDQVKAQWRSSEAVLLDRQGHPIQQSRADLHGRRLDWIPLASLPATLTDAVIRAEDKRFYQHAGIDWTALFSAGADTLGGDVRGASTLTMQLAGLLDPSLAAPDGHRSPWQKLRQMWQAHHLEAQWNKRQILEAYLNLAPFRGELVGIDAASRVMLGKGPSGLDGRDGILLASLLRAPNAPIDVLARRVCTAAGQASDSECATLRAYLLAVLARPPADIGGPAAAPELIAQLQPPPGSRIATTLDGPLQRAVRQILRDQIAQLDGRNVRDAAAIVIDNASGDVQAWVGSPGAGSSARFVDGVVAPRQAGSTLKPLLYSLAFEQKLLTPASLLDDSPVMLNTSGGEYVPQNYDHSFRGPVSVRRALASSLNIPAVRTLLLLGLDTFHARLNALGLSMPLPPEHYGFGLALGGAEVRLVDLANAYRTLANGGRASPWRLQAGQAGPWRQIIDPRAAWLATDILSDRAARAPAFGLDNALATSSWAAAKTGTSKDMRDNWAVGYTARHTIAVWVGNADGEPMWDVSGVTGAAPAWRAIVNLLHDGPTALPPPPGIETLDIRFQPAIEPPRAEHFIAGTGQSIIELAGNPLGANIVYPVSGLIVAIDPDIPPDTQKIWLRADGAEHLHWQLDGKTLATDAAPLAWSPVPGKHFLALADAGGHEKASVRFEVRGQVGR